MIGSASLWIIALITLLVYVIKYITSKCQRDPRQVKLAETLPGPPEWPIIGNSVEFYKEDKFKLMIDYKEKYGETYRIWLGKYLTIAFSNVEELEVVFMNSKMLCRPQLFQPFEDFFGHGLFVMTCVPRWRRQRKVFQSFFGRSALPKYTNIVNDKADSLVNMMKNKGLVDGPEFDAMEYLPNLTTDIMLKLLFNTDLSWDDKTLAQYYDAAIHSMDLAFKKISLPWLQYGPVDYLLYRKKARQHREDIGGFTRKFVESKKDEILREIEAHKNKLTTNSEDISPKSILTQAYESAEMEEDENVLVDILLELLLASGDPANMMSFFLLAVAIHQDIQNRLYNELFEVFGDSDRTADFNDLDRLPYLDQVLKESLRRFPTVPFLFRGVEEDVKIGGRLIPAGTMVLVSIPGVHFNPEYYPDPWNFNPDNFSPEVADKRHKLTFLAFSAGLRNCLGMNLAIFEMKLTIIALLRNFTFYTTMKMEDIHPGEGFTITSVDGFKLTISSRIKKPTY